MGDWPGARLIIAALCKIIGNSVAIWKLQEAILLEYPCFASILWPVEQPTWNP